jgi:hypothetical protein
VKYLSTRLGWLAACFAFVACASGPEPRSGGSDDGDGEVSKKRKKKKKKKKPRKSVAERELEAKREEERRAEEERKAEEEREKQAAKEEDEQGEVTIVDTDVEPEPKKAAKAKAKKAKKAKPEPEPESEDEPPAKKKKPNKEEIADTDSENGDGASESDSDDAEVAAKPAKTTKAKTTKAKKKEPPIIAAKAKPKKPKAEEDIPEIELDTAPEPEPEPDPPPKKKKAAKAEAAPPVADDSGVIEMTGEEEDDPLAERRVAAIPVPGVDDEGPTDEAEPEPVAPGTWPLQIGDRPLTIAKSKLAVHGGLDIYKLTLPNAAGTPVAATATGLALGATYGVGDKAEVGIDYVLGISPGTIRGPLTLHVAYRAVVKPKLEIALAGGIAVDSDSVTNEMTMTTTTTTFVGLQLGAWARYRLTRKASVFSGVPATPASAAPVSKLSLALPPLPYQLAIGLTNAAPIVFDVPAGLGYQLSPNVYAYGMFNLAHIAIKNNPNAFIFADFIPFALGGFYTRKQIDVGFVFSDDLKQGTDYLRLDLLLRYAIK